MDEHQDKDRQNIIESLRALSIGPNRSVTARVREIFDEIESALQAGVRIKDVHKVLADNGFGGTLRAFEVAIHRIRKARTGASSKHATVPTQTAQKSSTPILAQTTTSTIKDKKPLADDPLQRNKEKAKQYTPDAHDDFSNPLLKH